MSLYLNRCSSRYSSCFSAMLSTDIVHFSGEIISPWATMFETLTLSVIPNGVFTAILLRDSHSYIRFKWSFVTPNTNIVDIIVKLCVLCLSLDFFTSVL